MHDGRGFGGAGSRFAVPALVLWAVLMAALATARDAGLCIVFRLTRRAIPGCVPAWSADRAPPARATTI
ncbi:hypothetical protein COUCH_15620 [Couchioplanes caeruleus]|uniref:hypothetical protein n=1 Tax=Couchioplanes caeruleus TaxID=56438 RepID=UPI0020BF7800|nr:hypothetical protein [Couchioplanes caeruleus]UQU67608.1 hypothetical protein COUCH_15620 [Couchioplanes caeruleus]